MLVILLHILKIIGIVLLIILAVLVALFLTVLFVPVRYRILTASTPVNASLEHPSFGQAAMRNETKIRVKVSWLLHIFSVHFQLQLDGQVDADKTPSFDLNEIKKKMFCKIRLLGITILDLFHPKPKRKRKKSHPAGQKPAKKKQNAPGTGKKEKMSKEDSLKPQEEFAGTAAVEDLSADGQIPEPDAEAEPVDMDVEKLPFRSFFDKITGSVKKIFEKTAHIKYTVIETIHKIGKAKQKTGYYVDALTGENTRSARQKLLRLLQMIWRGVRPRKSRVALILGFKDPELTGKVLAVFGLCIPVFQDTVTVTPDFERFRFEMAGDIKGRITLFTFLRVGFKVLTDREIKQFIRLFTEPETDRGIK
ncbi:MAG: hypothetical protein E7294_06305 [Lachnospiraceae bacterium]|jgi:hypothetical protein|nr:hypothetical protein [Lachnospiraceae bacterium]